jgi:glycyl-tRNA synthetase
MDTIVSLSRRRGFVFPSSEIYGGLGSAYDYAHYGVLMKNNVKAAWLRAMVQEREDVVALDSALMLHPRVWEASGHVGGFSDPMVDCRVCKHRFRADDLESATCPQKPSKPPGQGPNCDLTEARDFNLMFETTIGPVKESGTTVYLRPETAQGIFINFKNVLQIARRKPPFGIAQVGKSFRNEITPGNFLFRTREFEQMEMEFFVPPDQADEWFRYWVGERAAWYHRYGIKHDNLRVRVHEASELSHYSSATSDLEYLYPIGWAELEGIANRGDYDLKQHAEFSGTKLEFVEQDGERYVPHVIEPAAGADRAFLAFLCDAYDEEEVAGRERVVLRLHPAIAPVKAAILPLLGNDAALGERRRVAWALPGRARHERRDRPALPQAGRDRHALGDHDRPRVARGRRRDSAGAGLARAGPRSDRRSPAAARGAAVRRIRAALTPHGHSETMTAMAAPGTPIEIHLISDSTGDTAARVARAAQTQFSGHRTTVVRHPRVTTVDDLVSHYGRVASRSGVVIFYTLVDRTLRGALEELCQRDGMPRCDLLGPPLEALAAAAGHEADLAPGRPIGLDADYFQRIAAMEFVVKHDDGLNGEGLENADIVLIGVSRTGKTPLSMYLGFQGYKTANVPLVRGIEPPGKLFQIDPAVIVGLTIEAERLAQIRGRRIGNLAGAHSRDGYAELNRIHEELEQASALQRRLSCPVLDVSNLAVEEAAVRVIELVEARAA